MGGKGDTGSSTQSNPYADTMASISNQLYNETDPMRKAIIAQLQNFVTGGTPSTTTTGTGDLTALYNAAKAASLGPQLYVTPSGQVTTYPNSEGSGSTEYFTAYTPLAGTGGNGAALDELYQAAQKQQQAQGASSMGELPWIYSPVYQQGKYALESQYQRAKENLIANSPAGGPIQDALTNLEQSRALGLGDLRSQIAQDVYNKAYGLATGAPGQAIQGLSGASNSYTALQNAAMAADAQQAASTRQALSTAGLGAGYLLGGGKSGTGLLSAGKGVPAATTTALSTLYPSASILAGETGAAAGGLSSIFGEGGAALAALAVL